MPQGRPSTKTPGLAHKGLVIFVNCDILNGCEEGVGRGLWADGPWTVQNGAFSTLQFVVALTIKFVASKVGKVRITR